MSHEQSLLIRRSETVDAPKQPARRRRFSNARKLAILAEAERCACPEQITTLLAREGLHCSQLTVWRKQLKGNTESAKQPTKRVRREAQLSHTISQLEQEKAQLQRELHLARQSLTLSRTAERLYLPSGCAP